MLNKDKSKVTVIGGKKQPEIKTVKKFGDMVHGVIYHGTIEKYEDCGNIFQHFGCGVIAMDQPGSWFHETDKVELIDFKTIDIQIKIIPR